MMQFVKPDINIDFIGKRKIAYVVSGLLILISIISLVIHGGPKYGIDFAGGTVIQVNTPTHIAGVMDFTSGAVGTIVTSFDVWAAELPRIEVYGTAGTLSVPDPNGFGGPVRVRRAGSSRSRGAAFPRGGVSPGWSRRAWRR